MRFAQPGTWLVSHIVYRCKFWFKVGLCGIFPSLSSSPLSPALHYPANADSSLHLTPLASPEISRFKPTFIPNHINLKRNKPEFILRRNCWRKGEIRWQFRDPPRLPCSNLCHRWADLSHTHTHTQWLSFRPRHLPHARQRCAGTFFSLIPGNTAGRAHPQPPGWSGDALGGQAGQSPHRPPPAPASTLLTFPSRPPRPPRGGGDGGGSVLTVEQAPRHLPPHGRAARRGHGRPRSAPAAPRPTREPAAPRRQPPPTPAPPAAAPALGAVMFIYIRRRRLRGFLK